MPLDPRLGKMIILGTIFGCANAMAIISANASNMSEVFNLGKI
jgi:ATP-dependent RNA helicase A